MPKIDIATLKSRFETGDRPNGQDYQNLIDTLASSSTDLGSNGNNENEIFGIENRTVIDSVVASEWRMLKYLISISKTTDGDNKFYATEISILIDGSNLNISEYGVMDNDGDIGTVDVSRVNGSISVSVTPNPAIKPVTVRFNRMGLKA